MYILKNQTIRLSQSAESSQPTSSPRDERLRNSFSMIGGLSFEEVTSDEIDDV